MSDSCDLVDCSLPGSSVHGISRKYWSGLPFPSPRIFPTQRLNPGLLHCRQIPYRLSQQGAPHRRVHIQSSRVPNSSTLKPLSALACTSLLTHGDADLQQRILLLHQHSSLNIWKTGSLIIIIMIRSDLFQKIRLSMFLLLIA